MENVGAIAPLAENIYRYLNFHEIAEFKAGAQKVLDVAIVAE
jgi:aconitase B